MSSSAPPGLRFRYASDRSVLVDCPDARTILRLLRWAQDARPRGIVDLHPAYASVLVVFNVLEACHEDVEGMIASADLEHVEMAPPRRIEIPVRYGGPDLADVAAMHSISEQEVIEIHSSVTYTARFLGFAPGFAYLSGLAERIATPRLAAPRPHVPPGSVGIGGNQTGVYPFNTPGGWRLIGRTELQMFDPERDPMSLIAIGDEVRFVPA